MVRATALVAACVVATTTLVSAFLGDLPVDVSPVPMISDTFVRAPASYVARAGVAAVACLLLVTTLLVRSFLKAFACEDGSRKDAAFWRRVTECHSCVGAAAALALLVVALLVLLEGLSFATSSNNSSALDVFFFDDDFGALLFCCVDFCGVVCRDERRVGVAIIYALFSLSLSENALVEK